MGFGTIFATIAFVMIIGITSYFVITGTLFSMDTLSNSLKKMNEIENARLKMEIEIGENVSVTDSSPGSKINVFINNTGSTKISKSDYKHIDIFIHYNATGAGNITNWIPYNETNSTAVGDNEWTVEDISPDLVNPRIFDPDEKMTIVIKVYPAIEKNSTNWIKVVTPNAVSDFKHFEG
jgi:flagellar protein FlaF